MKRGLSLFWVLCLTATPLIGQAKTEPAPQSREAKWEKEVAAIEKSQTAKQYPKEGIVFAGSSSIRLWKLDEAFPEWKPINSGFGGSEIRDSTIFAKRLIFPHQPKTIVFYAGDNDIASGRKPAQLLEDFTAFTKAIHAELPKTTIYFIAVKPSIARLKMLDAQKEANQLISEYCSKDARLQFIDIAPLMYGTDQKLNPELFAKDGLHLSPQGYTLWNAAVKKAVK